MDDVEFQSFLREHGGIDGLARKLGQCDAIARRFEPGANDNVQVKLYRERHYRPNASLVRRLLLCRMVGQAARNLPVARNAGRLVCGKREVDADPKKGTRV